MKAAIEIHKVSKTYPGVTALNSLSLTVPAGAIFALLGDNGAGKSTTIRILNGLTPCDRGYDWMTVQQIGWFTSGFQGNGYLNRYLNLVRQFLLEPRARLDVLSKGQYAKVGLALALA